MSVDSVDREPPKFRVGAALSKTFSVLFRNIVPFGILALIFNVPLLLLSQFGTGSGTEGVGMGLLPQAVIGLATILLSFLLSATLVYGTILELRGGRAGIVECMTRGFGLLLPVIGVGILVSLAIAVAVFVSIVPGLFFNAILVVAAPLGMIAAGVVAVMFSVAIPAAVVERPGVMASLTRSRELTKGNRWRVFGLFVLLVIINFVITGAMSLVFGVSMLTAGAEASTLLIIVNLLAQAFMSALFAVTTAVIYHDLRIAKEGVNVEQIAAVFE